MKSMSSPILGSGKPIGIAGMTEDESPIFASLRDLCGFAVNSSHPVAAGSKAIAMSLEWPADLLIKDESSGRAMARNLNIRITDTLG
jgi:hypothetical protein